MIDLRDLILAVEALDLARGQAQAADSAAVQAVTAREVSTQAAAQASINALAAQTHFRGLLRAVGEQSKAALLMATRSAGVGVKRSAAKADVLAEAEDRLKTAQASAEAKQKLLVRGQSMAAETAAIRDAIIRAHELSQQAADSRQDSDSRYTEQKLGENRAAAMKAAEAASSQAGNLNDEASALIAAADAIASEVTTLCRAKETEDAATYLATQAQQAAAAVDRAVQAFRTQYAE